MEKIIKIILYLILLILPGTLYADVLPAKFITIADIHFDPFAGCDKASPCLLAKKLQQAPATQWQEIFEKYSSKNFSEYYQDTDYALLKSSLDEVQKKNAEVHAQYIFLLGDFIAHDFNKKFILYTKDHNKSHYQAFIYKVFAFLNLQIKNEFKNSSVIPVVGNNDSYTGNYKVVANGEFFSQIGNLWESLLKEKNNLNTTFKKAGFYSININAKNRIIVLNSVLFSSHDTRDLNNLAAKTELAWFANQLAEAKKNHIHVLILMHIPPGQNAYAFYSGGPAYFWKENFSKIFAEDLEIYKDTISAVLAGHVHIVSRRINNFPHPKEIEFLLTGSISPIYGNNPSFNIYEFNADNFRLLDAETFYLPLNNSFAHGWQKEFSFF